MSDGRREDEPVCAGCARQLRRKWRGCPGCGAPYHPGCLRRRQACATPACPTAWPTTDPPAWRCGACDGSLQTTGVDPERGVVACDGCGVALHDRCRAPHRCWVRHLDGGLWDVVKLVAMVCSLAATAHAVWPETFPLAVVTGPAVGGWLVCVVDALGRFVRARGTPRWGWLTGVIYTLSPLGLASPYLYWLIWGNRDLPPVTPHPRR